MGDSKIEWTDKTWNPATGCTKVSTGCKHCYADRLFSKVYSKDRVIIPTPADGITEETAIPPHEPTGHWTRPRKFTDVWLHPERLDQPLHWKKPCMVFVNSMSDLFHEDIPFEFIDKIFARMFIANWHTFQILTKRPLRALEYFNEYKSGKRFGEMPLPNVWLGISCENQATADERIPILLQVPAAVRFLSCEPLLDEISLSDLQRSDGKGVHHYDCLSCDVDPVDDEAFHGNTIDWVIVGGESGPSYRPMDLRWARDIRDQCAFNEVPFFFKQTAGKKAIPGDLQIRKFPI